jgi:hypothetical protein
MNNASKGHSFIFLSYLFIGTYNFINFLLYFLSHLRRLPEAKLHLWLRFVAACLQYHYLITPGIENVNKPPTPLRRSAPGKRAVRGRRRALNRNQAYG